MYINRRKVLGPTHNEVSGWRKMQGNEEFSDLSSSCCWNNEPGAIWMGWTWNFDMEQKMWIRTRFM